MTLTSSTTKENNAMKLTKALGGISALTLGLGVMALGVTSASAHTPNVNANCDGVTGSGTAYGKAGAMITVTVDGQSESAHIGDKGSLTGNVPQDYQVHTWSVNIDGPGKQYDLSRSGTVGPCGERPQPDQPPALVESVPVTNAPDCDARTVTTVTTTTTTPYVWDEESWTWVTGEPVVTTETTSRDATDEECEPPVVIPEQPADVVTVTPKTKVDCDTYKTRTRTVTTPYVYDEASNTWVLGTPGEPVVSAWTYSTPTAEQLEAAGLNCAVVVVPPVEEPPAETPPVVTPPVETPPVVTPPVVTPPVVTPPTTVQVFPEVHVETPAVTAPPVAKAPATQPVADKGQLAFTGFDAYIWGGAAVTLLFAGVALVLFNRRNRA